MHQLVNAEHTSQAKCNLSKLNKVSDWFIVSVDIILRFLIETSKWHLVGAARLQCLAVRIQVDQRIIRYQSSERIQMPSIHEANGETETSGAHMYAPSTFVFCHIIRWWMYVQSIQMHGALCSIAICHHTYLTFNYLFILMIAVRIWLQIELSNRTQRQWWSWSKWCPVVY